MVESVSELIPLGGQIPPVLVVRDDLERHLLDHVEAEPVEAGDLLRVVREDPDRGEAEVGEDLVADPPVARVHGEAEREVCLDGVEPLGLELVGAQLVEKPDPAALLRHVEEDAAPLARDLRERLLALLAAVAEKRVEDIAGEALGVDADEHVLGALDIAGDERDVHLAGELLAECDRPELAVLGREPTDAPRSTSFSWRRRYSTRSATVIIRRPWRSQ